MANMTPRTKRNRRERVLATHGRVCWICGKPIGDDLTLDHVKAKSEGGSNGEENLRPAHWKCNFDRHH
ncbi:HNH endonuclease [Myxococcota bacterium]|jgi:5-methylcytosine-specific restriction endonuclease McrA|nr:HNH endonuclease [Myxococcota bacterium]